MPKPFYGAIKSTDLAFAKTSAMRVIMHIDKSPAIVILGRPACSSEQRRHVGKLMIMERFQIGLVLMGHAFTFRLNQQETREILRGENGRHMTAYQL